METGSERLEDLEETDNRNRVNHGHGALVERKWYLWPKSQTLRNMWASVLKGSNECTYMRLFLWLQRALYQQPLQQPVGKELAALLMVQKCPQPAHTLCHSPLPSPPVDPLPRYRLPELLAEGGPWQLLHPWGLSFSWHPSRLVRLQAHTRRPSSQIGAGCGGEASTGFLPVQGHVPASLHFHRERRAK